MSREAFELAYDGPSLRKHQMDVRELGPALLGVGNLIRESNLIINGDAADVRVLINSEFRPGSFGVGLEVWQNLIETVTPLLGDDGIKTAKDLLEWLDLLVGPAAGAATGMAGVLGYYKWRNGREIQDVQHISDTGKGGTVNITIKGDGNTLNLDQRIFDLSHKPKIAKAAKAILDPLKSSGVDTLRTTSGGKKQLEIRNDDAEKIVASCDAIIKDDSVLSRNPIEAHLSLYDVEFSPDATKWQFVYGGKTINVDISETSIASDAVSRRVVSMDDLYHVVLEITERLLPSGKITNDYKILKLIERKRGARQDNLFEDNETDEGNEVEDGSEDQP